MFLAAILKAHTQGQEPAESAAPERKPEDQTASTDSTGSWPSFRPLGQDLSERTRWV